MNNKELTESIYEKHNPFANSRQPVVAPTAHLFKSLVDEMTESLPKEQKRRIQQEFFGWGPLEQLLDRDDIFDIMIQGPDSIFFENCSGIHRLNDQFLSSRSFQSFLERLKSQAEIQIDKRDPFGNGQVHHFRVHMIVPPISQKVCITLRRHLQKSLSFEDLVESEFMNEHTALFLKKALEKKENFLIVGPTGSGKTTFLNSLIAKIPENQRLVIIEDTKELITQNPLHCQLVAREVCPETLKPVFMEDLVKQSLRMRPDRIMVGEVRGREAKDLLLALSTGHQGSAGTLHADSAPQALLRLEMLVQMGAPHWSLHTIRQLIHLSLQTIIVLDSDKQKKKVKEIHRIASHESFGLLLEKIHLKSS
ncbi:MAG: ATPase, T2SS/T4P/T4SS family [Pseudomonadota bacterium]